MTGISLTDSGYDAISDAPIFFILPDDQAPFGSPVPSSSPSSSSTDLAS
eukprot:CAMPEP_0194084196 /NCGR_PEP_ID=MMETSP0149-20130528/12177_1 /TAXON_ID=122233 /ORGANISM="Chaetoceros debilis, Strain MM31A-1" /LENGTH=48 /DNA_ID= /DNA_START= /DNA_END= /DNA_ORIENTATION=